MFRLLASMENSSVWVPKVEKLEEARFRHGYVCGHLTD
jgi:hypothetical protein